MERLSADLVPFIADRNAALALARVVSAAWTPLPAERMERGEIRLEIVEAIRGAGLRAHETIEVIGKRLADESARDRSNFDQWNVLPFEQGDFLVMALRATTAAPPRHWAALAAQPADSAQDPKVAALRRAAEIEAMPSQEARRPALEQALTSHTDLLRDYALDAAGRRAMVPREAAAAMMERALFAADLPARSRIPLARELSSRSIYRYELGADPVNVLVIRSLARLVTDGEPARVPLWTQFLASCLTIEFSEDPAKDAEMRRALIRAVTDPPPQRVIAALQRQVDAGTKDPRTAKLLAEWRAATG